MECVAGRAGKKDRHREPGACALRARGGRGAAGGGNLRIRKSQVGVRRKYFAGGAIRAVGKCPGGHYRDVACFGAGDARWQAMGNSREDAPRDRAGSDHSEKCHEQRCGAGVSGICEEQGGPGDSGKVRFCFYRIRPFEHFALANMDALFLSFRLALCVSVILLVIGMPVAYWLAFSSWRGKFLLESVVALPLVLPPTVLGFYALVAMGPRGPLGKLWVTLFGHGLAFTFSGLILASVMYSFPFAVQPLVASFEGVDRKLLDASAVLGAGGLRTFWRVILPLSLPGVVTAAVLSFAHTLGEFGVVLMVGGNLAGVTRTVSIDIYDRVQSLEYGEANHLALILLAIAFAVLCLVYAVNRRVWTPWTAK